MGDERTPDHLIDEGSGPPLVVFHGWNGSKHNVLRWLPALAPRFRVIVPDLPGCNSLPPLPERHTTRGGPSGFTLIVGGLVMIAFLLLLVTNPRLAMWLLWSIASGGRGGGGGFGGGGGGGGGFSGGGGRSGGGGASGGW